MISALARTQARPATRQSLTVDEAIGFTVNQMLFAHGMTRAELGSIIGITGQNASSRLHGRSRWTAQDLLAVSMAFEVSVADLMPSPAGDGSWIPAQYVPGQQKAPAPAGTGTSTLVAGTGFEPATSG